MKSLTKIKLLCFAMVAGDLFTTANAFPEFVRFGYQSCSSCHVSPAGGGILTSYGRSFASEKLSTWSYENEEQLLHGAVLMPEWLIIGGNVRQLQSYVETPRARDARWLPMQRDFDACVSKFSATFCATIGITKPAALSGDQHSQYGMRKYMLKYDVNDYASVRLGRFFTRYGLMIANHTSAIRKGLGFFPLSETDHLELNFANELFDLSLAQDLGKIISLAGEPSNDKLDHPKGPTLFAALSVGASARVGLSARHLTFIIKYYRSNGLVCRECN